MLRALIWDVDGTLAETERDGHRRAFNAAFSQLGLTWSWDVAYYGELLRITGGYERLMHDMASRADAPQDAAQREELAREVHHLKNRHYAWLVRQGRIPLREGVRDLIEDCVREGVRLAIATTTSRSNVDALMEVHFGLEWAQRFASIACAEDAPLKKPHPQVYTLTLERLGLAPHETVAMEDSPNGVAAACEAGVPVLVAASEYFKEHDAVRPLALGESLAQPLTWNQPACSDARVGLDCIRTWHAATVAA